MDYLTVGDLKQKLQPKLHGTSFSRLAGVVFDKMGEAATTMLNRIDPDATQRRFRIVNAIYDQIYNYTCPPDLKGKQKISDIRPLSQRGIRDDVGGRFEKQFDLRKANNTIAIETLNGLRTLRISKCFGQIIPVWTADDLILGGVVTGFGDTTDLSTDDLDYVSGFGSISFNLSGVTGIGGIYVDLTNGVDLTKLLNLGALFAWLEYPDSDLVSVELQWGSDSSNYWKKTVTTPYGYPSFLEDAWEILGFLWKTATMIGTPDVADIKFLRITLNYPIGDVKTGVHVDNITAQLGKAYEVLYYSNCCFLDVDGVTWKTVPTSDDDTIMLDGAALNILMYETFKVMAAELKGKNMIADMANARLLLEGDGRVVRGAYIGNNPGMYRDYLAAVPSEAMSSQESYYDFGGDNDDGRPGGGVEDEEFKLN